MIRPLVFPFLSVLLLISCTKNDSADDSVIDNSDDDVIIEEVENTDDSFGIPNGKTFEWRLDDLPNSYTTTAEVVDIDAFSATPELITNLQAQGKIVIAYLSVGSVENFREDASDFPDSVVGNVYEGFEDEKWLDIREIDLIAPVLRARFDMIAAKGFDAIEPDNINGYQNNTGFSLTVQDAAVFSRWLIEEAHSRDLGLGQKNAEELISEMVDEFDWILSEGAYADSFADQLAPYITANKAVFLTEYTDQISTTDFINNVCPYALEKGYSAVLKNRDLTDTTVFCD